MEAELIVWPPQGCDKVCDKALELKEYWGTGGMAGYGCEKMKDPDFITCFASIVITSFWPFDSF